MSGTTRTTAGFLAAWLFVFTAALPGLHTCAPVADGGGATTTRVLPGGGRHAGHARDDCPACHFGTQGQIGPPPTFVLAAPVPVRELVSGAPLPRADRFLVLLLPRGPPPPVDV